MEFTGKVVSISKDWQTDKYQICFSVNESSAMGDVDEIRNCDKLSIKAKKYKEKRSGIANKFLWACLSDIAKSMTPPEDVWDVYLRMLKRYGEFTYITVKPELIEATKRIWRETQVVGEIEVDGEKRVEMLCFFGSSTLDTKEFSVLLDGVISEMEQMGLKIPLSKDKQKALGL